MLDRRQATPLYHQIFLALRDEIVGGTRTFGSSVPTERELADGHGISRITARRALDELAQAGFVERKRRIGTRVVYRSPVRPIDAGINQAVEALIAFGRDTQVRMLDLAEEAADATVAAALGLEPGAAVVRAVRLRSLDDEPLGRVTSWMPREHAPQMPLDELATTPMLELLRRAGLTIGTARQTIGGGAADPALAALLGVEPRAPLLWIERLVRDAAGRPTLFTRAEYRADRYRITLELNGEQEAVLSPDAG